MYYFFTYTNVNEAYTLAQNVNRPYTLTHITFIMPYALTWNVSPKLYKHTTQIKKPSFYIYNHNSQILKPQFHGWGHSGKMGA
jgi:hypothetical protein